MYFKTAETGSWDKGRSWQIFRPVLLHSSSHQHATFSCTMSQMQSESSYLNWTPKDTTVATKKFSFLDTLCHRRLRDLWSSYRKPGDLSWAKHEMPWLPLGRIIRKIKHGELKSKFIFALLSYEYILWIHLIDYILNSLL